jgi:TIGR03009 family protein
MANRIYLLASLAAAIVFCVTEAAIAQGDPGVRPYRNSGADQNGYQNAEPNRSAWPSSDVGQQDDLDKILDAWEKKNGQIKTFKCTFNRWQYDPVFFTTRPGEPEQAKQTSQGEIKYSAPDKGLLRETGGDTWSINPTSHKPEQKKLEALEHWACDGKQVYKVDYQQRTVEEIPIPPELQGQGITQGPLPFVFGAKAAELKARYYIRLTTPADAKGQAWLEIRPKNRRDAENFSKVNLILRTNDMFPQAIEIYGTNGQDRDAFLLEPKGFDPREIFGGDFNPSPFGFKHVKHQPQAAPAPQPGGQAQRMAPDSGRR